MLDQDIQEQLKSAFSQLENTIELVYVDNKHADQDQLLEMLNGIANTSEKIKVIRSEKVSTRQSPEFFISKNGKPSGIVFQGIPGGHEFTSLIVAILNADGKGKLPDQKIIQRIKSLKGPIKIKTVFSLTCENCPDVVQALNQMAIFHGNFQHTGLDGAYFQEDLEKLGIQGVPAVIVNDQLIHSGRINFIDLLTKLEETFGIDESKHNESSESSDLGNYDVVVIGGGPAGASAAIYSVRKGFKTAIIADRFGGQVQDTLGIENLISIPYTEGPKLASDLMNHMSKYPIEFLEHRRVEKIEKDTKKIHIQGGEHLIAKSIIIATGAKWRELNIPGEKEYLGKGVAFCPHCDGPFYKGKKIAVIGGGNSGIEAAIDLAGIVKEVVVFEYNDQLKADQVLINKLKSLPNTKIITSALTKNIIGDEKTIHTLEYIDRKTETMNKEELSGVFVQIGLVPNSQFVKDIVETTKFGEIVVDNKGRTNVPGIYAAGDVTTTPYKQIIIAMGEGAKAALAAFEDMMVR